MLRIALLAAALLALAASSSDSYQFRQRGTVAAPRAAIHDGQPMAGPVRIEGHAGVIAGADQPVVDGPATESAAAIAGKQAGGALRVRIKEVADLGVEVDTAWSPSSTTRDGVRISAPDDHVIDYALAFRSSPLVSADNNLRLGLVANLGGHSVPIVRGDSPLGPVQRDHALLFRAALVPSIRRGAVTVFGSFGLATDTDVAATVFVAGDDGDPGVVAESSGIAVTAAVGARVELGGGGFATARLSDAFTDEANEHYGPQVDVGVGFDLGR